MERDWLEAQLAAGRSIESVAHEVGKHPSTVAYWVKKHGLRSTHASKHAARGGIAHGVLEPLVAEGWSVRAIARHLGVSYATVQHWIGRYGLTTRRAARLKASAGARREGLAGGRPRLPATRFDLLRPEERRRLPMPSLPVRGRRQPQATRPGAARGRGGRAVRAVRLRPARSPPFSSITSTSAARRSPSLAAVPPARSKQPGRRPRNACSCAGTAMRKWGRESLHSAPILPPTSERSRVSPG